MMKPRVTILSLCSNLLLILLSQLSNTIRAAAVGSNSHILLHPRGHEPFSAVKHFALADANPVTSDFNSTHITTIANLTDEQATQVSINLQPVYGIVEKNFLYQLPKAITYSVPPTISQSSAQRLNILSHEVPPYPNVITKQAVVILDSLPNANIPALNGFNNSVLYNFVDPKPCYFHGSAVTEIISSKFTPEIADILFLFVAVFNCQGTTSIAILLAALQTIIDYAKTSDRFIHINFSGGGYYSKVLNAGFANAVAHGIRVVTSAGNLGYPCDLYSPASETTVETIGALQGSALADYSNFGTPDADCVDLYLQGCLTNIGCGTSFATPQEVVRGIARKQAVPNDTPAKIKAALRAATVTVPMHPTTPTDNYTMRVITPALVYPWINVITTQATVHIGPISLYRRWYPVPTSSNKPCISFTVKTSAKKNGASSFAIEASDGMQYRFVMDISKKRSGFSQCLKANNKLLNCTTTAARLVNGSGNSFIVRAQANSSSWWEIIQEVGGDARTMLTANFASVISMQQVAFNTQKPQATFSNVLRC